MSMKLPTLARPPMARRLHAPRPMDPSGRLATITPATDLLALTNFGNKELDMRSVVNEVRDGIDRAAKNIEGSSFCTTYQKWMGGACGREQRLDVKRRAVIMGKLIDKYKPIVSFAYDPNLQANAQAWGYANCVLQDTTQLRSDTNQHNTIEIGPSFFDRKRWVTASRAETILHELSHRVFGARDQVDAAHCAGQAGNVCDYPGGARALAANNAVAAACNAENWGQLFNELGGTSTL